MSKKIYKRDGRPVPYEINVCFDRRGGFPVPHFYVFIVYSSIAAFLEVIALMISGSNLGVRL